MRAVLQKLPHPGSIYWKISKNRWLILMKQVNAWFIRFGGAALAQFGLRSIRRTVPIRQQKEYLPAPIF
jgi:hypothetical protein